MLTLLILFSLSFATGFARADRSGVALAILSEEIALSDHEFAGSGTSNDEEELSGTDLDVNELTDLDVIEETDLDVIGATLCKQNDNKRDCLDQDLGENPSWCIWHGVFGYCDYIVQGESEVEINMRSVHEGLEDGDIIMGDIVVDEEVRREFGLSTTSGDARAQRHAKRRRAVRDQSVRWPDREMKYFFHPDVPVSRREEIVHAMMDMTNDTGGCIRFKHAAYVDNQYEEALMFRDEAGFTGCYLSKHWGGSTTINHPDHGTLAIQGLINLGSDGCYTRGVIQHEMMHALGFHHEQSRPDRDQYVTINWDDLDSSDANYSSDTIDAQFATAAPEDADTQGKPYDYLSVMHYGAGYFSDSESITTTQSWAQDEIGQRTGLSALDVEDIREAYCPLPVSSHDKITYETCEDHGCSEIFSYSDCFSASFCEDTGFTNETYRPSLCYYKPSSGTCWFNQAPTNAIEATTIREKVCDCTGQGQNLNHRCHGRVRLYKHNDFDTLLTSKWKGSYNLEDEAHNQVSSIKVDPGCKAILFDEPNMHGWTVTIGEGDWTLDDLEDIGFYNDDLSHIVVVDATEDHSFEHCPGVKLYPSDYFGGTQYTRSVGDWDLNITAGSLKVPRGCLIQFSFAMWYGLSIGGQWFGPGDYLHTDIIGRGVSSFNHFHISHTTSDGVVHTVEDRRRMQNANLADD